MYAFSSLHLVTTLPIVLLHICFAEHIVRSTDYMVHKEYRNVPKDFLSVCLLCPVWSGKWIQSLVAMIIPLPRTYTTYTGEN